MKACFLPMTREGFTPRSMKMATLCLVAIVLLPSIDRAQTPAAVPVFKISHESSTVKFNVSASVAISGTFDKWDASVTFTSPELATAVLDIKIQAASVNTGSGMKDGKLKSKDFFDAEHDPLITFH